jgi:hypothetical protein
MSDAPAPTRLLAANTRQARKLRVLTWSFAGLALAACVWAGSGDPAAYVLAPIAVMFAAAMHLYCFRYVTSLEVEGDVLLVRTAGLGAPLHRIARSKLGARTYHDGAARYGGEVSVDAPWITLRVEGFRIPFVIDAQIETLDLNAIKRL